MGPRRIEEYLVLLMPLKTLIMEMEFRRHTELSTTLGFIMSRKVGLYDMRIFYI